MKTVSLICHVERCSQNDRGTQRCFSLNLSAALGSGAPGDGTAELRAAVETWLRPWTWVTDFPPNPSNMQTAKLTVAAIQTDGKAIRIDDVRAVAPLLTESGAATAWQKVLEGRLSKLKDAAKQLAFQWPVQTAGGVVSTYEYNGDDPDTLDAPSATAGRRWFAELLDISRETAPLPHAAKLTWHFWVDDSQLGAALLSVAAAPVFRFAAGEIRRPAWKDAAQDSDVNDSTQPLHRESVGAEQHLQWAYEPNDAGGSPLDPAITAYLNEAPIAAVGPWNGLWKDGWIDLKDGYFAEDWLGELEWRAADLFDLPALILRYLPTLEDYPDERGRPPSPFKVALELYRPIVERSLRDLAQTGASCRTRVLPGAPNPRIGDPTLLNDYGLAADALREIARLEGKWKDNGRLDETFANEAAAILRKLETWETTGAAPEPGKDSLDAWWSNVLKRITSGPTDRPFDVLRALHAFVSDEDRARDLIFEQWDHVLGNAWSAARRELLRANVLPSLGVRKRLALMHLGVRWESIVGALRAVGETRRTPAELADILRVQLLTTLRIYLQDRAQRQPTEFTDRPLAAHNTDQLPFEPFLKWLDEFLLSAVGKTVLAGSDHPDQLEPGLQPDGILFQVADVQGDPVGDQDPDDPLRGIAGFGLLLREKNAAAHCLTLADVLTGPAATFSPMGIADTKLVASAVVPVRVVGRNGVRRCMIGYNNEPICALSPASALARNYQLQDSRKFGGALHFDRWARLENPYHSGGPRLLSLRFSQEYQAAAFVIGVGGSLPTGLSDPDLPDTTKPHVDPGKWGPPDAQRWLTFTYRRRVAVGQVRLQSRDRPTGKLGDELALPPIPASVHPLTRSLHALAEQHRAAATADLRASAGLAPEEALSDQDYAELLERVLGESATELRQSLVLLVPPVRDARDSPWDMRTASERFPFEVLRPAVDLRVWDRSFHFLSEGTPVTDLRTQRSRAQRAQLWQESFENARDNPAVLPGTNVTIDDPTVEKLLVRMTRLFPAPKVEIRPRLIEFRGWTGTGGLENERATPLPCVIKSAVAAPGDLARLIVPPDPHAPPGSDARRWQFLVPKGEVWSLELVPVIPSELKDTFQARLWDYTFEEWTDADGKAYRLGAARRFLLETATDELPSNEALHCALRARAVAGGVLGPVREPWTREPVVWRERVGVEALRAGWRTEVALDPTLIKTKESQQQFHWLHRVSVLVQRWRWNGRPLRDFWASVPSHAPDPAAGLLPEEQPWTPTAFFNAWVTMDEAQLTAWDGRLFGDRAGTDYRRHDATVDLTAGGGPQAGAHRVFHQDVSGDLGALYLRYAIQVHSRYEGLLRSPPLDSRYGLGAAVPEAWRRLVVPCRQDKELPPPRIKLVLPLTDVREATGVDSSMPPELTPGLLVVLSEPWFRYGGLAEELVVEVASAEEPVRPTPEDLPPRRAELGPDPIVQAIPLDVIVPPGDSFPGSTSFEPLPAYGPIGHTFDTDTLAPEFIHTSFVVPAPVLYAPPPENSAQDASPLQRDLAWYFVKLRFRRRIEAAGLALSAADLESEPTGPLWAQFLPPSSHFATEDPAMPARVAELCLASRPTSSGPEWFLARPGAPTTPVKLRGTQVEGEPAGPSRFQLWALVTEPLFDAFGRLSQETFLDFCLLDAGVLHPKNTAWTADAHARRRVRIVEVQVLPSQEQAIRDADLDAIRRFFFPDNSRNLAEARARCVRISGPIEPLP